MGTVIQNSKLSSIKAYEIDREKYEIKLDANESFLSFPMELREELKNRLMNVEFNRYPDPESEEVCRLYAEYCGVKPSNVLSGNGSDELIQIIVNGFMSKEEKILTFAPDFSMYKFYTSIMEGKIVELSLDENMKIDGDKVIERANQEHVKIVIFSNPNNPVGVVVPREDILKIVENCNALVVVDEAYFEFYGESVVDCINQYENLIVLRTCSKAVGLAAVRLGFLIANEELIRTIRKVKPPFNVNALSQLAGEIVLKNSMLIGENVSAIVRERDYLFNELKLIENSLGKAEFRVFPGSANFAFIRTGRAEEIYSSLLERSISIRNFNNRALRITVGSRSENEALVTALKVILGV
jgi:histidinol-phosphate aminotransferase